MAENFANNARSELAGNITTVATVLTVKSAASFPAPNFRIVIDSEIMLVTGVSGNNFTVTRAIEGTVAEQHAAGADVVHVITAGGMLAAFGEAPEYMTEAEVTALLGTYLTEADIADFITAADIADFITDADIADFVTETDVNTIINNLNLDEGAPVISTGDVSYLVVAGDVTKYLRFTGVAAKDVTFNSTLPTGEYHIRNVGAGDLTLIAGAGVTLNAPAAGTLVLAQYMTVTVKKVGAAEFDIFGQTVAA